MMSLMVDLDTSADLLGTAPQQLQTFLNEKTHSGVLRFEDGWHISLFTLAEWLNTTIEEMLDLLADEEMGVLMDEVATDEVLRGKESYQVYQQYLAESSQ